VLVVSSAAAIGAPMTPIAPAVAADVNTVVTVVNFKMVHS
jgi:hypothetical protein